MLSPVALALLVGEPYPLLSWVYVRSKLGVAGLFVLLSWVLIPAGALLAGAALLTISIALPHPGESRHPIRDRSVAARCEPACCVWVRSA